MRHGRSPSSRGRSCSSRTCPIHPSTFLLTPKGGFEITPKAPKQGESRATICTRSPTENLGVIMLPPQAQVTSHPAMRSTASRPSSPAPLGYGKTEPRESDPRPQTSEGCEKPKIVLGGSLG